MTDLRKIAFCKIYPPVGIARVGDSEEKDAYFWPPEWPGAPMQTPGGPVDREVFRYRDAHGKVKRQAAHFRIYAYDKDERVLGQLTDADAVITWTVTLANKKAAWFEFAGTEGADSAFRGDAVPKSLSGRPLRARNLGVGKLERKQGGPRGHYFAASEDRAAELEIHGPVRHVAGPNRAHDPANSKVENRRALDFTGLFKKRTEVYLGEIATDSKGHLLVLGGRGVSRPVDEEGRPLGDPQEGWITHYANNDLWHDDTSDGPVTATVSLRAKGKRDGEKIEVRGGAWVIVAPPDFAPDTTNIVTLYDVMEEVALDASGLVNPTTPRARPPANPDLRHDIWPIVQRAAGYRWVSLLGLRGHGQGKPGDGLAGGSATYDAFVEALGRQGEELRARLISMLRRPVYIRPDGSKPSRKVIAEATAQATATYMPPLSGDEGDRTAGEPATWLSITHVQYERMQQWRASPLLLGPEIPLPDFQLADGSPHPDTLTRAILDRCCGGAFFPGIEITSIAREPKLYEEAFRFNHAVLGAGDITKYMALPWQADFFECRSQWWPAQRPDDVILEDSFREIFASYEAEKTGDLAGTFERVLINRVPWDRGVGQARPRPGSNFLLRWVLPITKADESADQYAERVASRWATILLRAEPPEDRASPWRRQFLVQEVCDTYSGRYVHLRVPAPESALEMGNIAADHAEFVKRFAIASLSDLRQVWREAAQVDEAAISAALAAIGDAYDRLLAQSLQGDIASLIKGHPDFPVQPAASGSADAFRARITNTGEATISGLDQAHPEEIYRGSTLHRRYGVIELRDALLDRAYIVNSDQNGDNGMVQEWRRLGFVVERTYPLGNGDKLTANVETERDKYDGASYRDQFYYLLNIQNYPDFELEARRLAERMLEFAQSVIDSTSIENRNHPESFVPFDDTTFKAKLDEIYEILRQRANNFDVFFSLRRNNREAVIRGMLDNAPFNQCDGAWLRHISAAGPGDDVRALLFEVWSDEIGNGDPALHHGTLYTVLLKNLGAKLQDVTTRAYADDPQIPESSYVSPVFQLAISQHTDRFFPELLGMTLYLEWEVLSLVTGITLYDYLGIDSKFWRMHVGIDNATNGHGAKARDAVLIYLDKVRNEGGEPAVQEHWARVWRGFVAFEAVDSYAFGDDDAIARRRPPNPARRLEEVMTRKRKYGSLNHLSHRLGRHRINDLFEQPQLFQAELAASRWIVPGDPDASQFFKYLTTFEGPMYKIFDPRDLATWRDWIEWLGKEGDTPTIKRYFEKGEAMEKLLHELRSVAQAVAAHGRYRIGAIGTANGGHPKKLAIAEFFATNDIIGLMRALREPENGWIVKGSPADSPMVADLARGGRPMGDVLDRRYPTIGNRIGRQIVIEWVRAGCPVPGDPPPAAVERADQLKPLGPKLFMHTLGIGAVH
jgi:L-Lysine epsilon oxidase N-terminal/L-lysine epsilon oxidase C-terminal domain/Iron-containing redox enzyme